MITQNNFLIYSFGVGVLNSILGLLKKKQGLRIKLLIIFLILIYLPISLNTYIGYNKTINIIKKEKIDFIEEILEKTSQNIDMNINNINELVDEFTSLNGVRKSLEDYERLNGEYQSKIENYLVTKLGNIKEKNVYIDDIFCLTKEGKIFPYDQMQNLNISKLYQSPMYDKLSMNTKHIIYEYEDLKSMFNDSKDEDSIYMIHNITALDGNKVVGHVLTLINIDRFKTLYEDIPFNSRGQVVIFNKDKEVLMNFNKHTDFNTRTDLIVRNSKELKKDEIVVDNTEYSLVTEPLPSLNWYVMTITPVEYLVQPIKEDLNDSLWLILLISILISLWIVIEILILSKLASEKEMASYRLTISEELNYKLRMYKHDFVNHLQIIQGLLELNKPNRALQYIKNVVQEGRLIKNKYEIGIPEIESTILTFIKLAKEHNIDVEVDSIKLIDNLSVKIYDLTKILTNLLKNAIQALISTNKEYKKLTIRIYEELDEYVFEIINNVPLIPEEARSKIFEKGYTTKEGKGNGLGLYIVDKLVKKNNGSIKLKVDNEGNHFIVRFLQR